MADVFYGAYMDNDPAAGARDWSCGFKSYDGHGGVDILLRNFRVQDLGVPVIAAAGGTVIGTSDGLPDRNTTWDVGGYGNHVEISHPGGLTTIYGHLRRGSIAVTQGQQVGEGALLGLVGSSGKSNWPHLHFEVRRSGAAVDPFAGGCSVQESLWTNQLAYQDAFMVMDAGLTDQPVTLAALLERPPTLSAFPLNAAGFRLWVQTANQRASTVRYELYAPGGALRETVQQQVGATFSTRYLVLNVAVSGALSEAGAWEIGRTRTASSSGPSPSRCCRPRQRMPRAPPCRPRPPSRCRCSTRRAGSGRAPVTVWSSAGRGCPIAPTTPRSPS